MARIFRGINAQAARSRKPVLLLDLDSTLYEVGPRTHEILNEWSATPEGRGHEALAQAVARLESSHIGYSLRDTFSAIEVEITDPRYAMGFESAKNYWSRSFFNNDYLKY